MTGHRNGCIVRKISELRHKGVITTTTDDLILPREAAQIIGKTERYVLDLADQGKLPVAREEPYGKTRRRRWFRRADVEAYAHSGTS